MKPIVNEADVRLLLDENISPGISLALWASGTDALPVRDRSMQGSSDRAIMAFAQKERRAVTTINEYDFRQIAMNMATHSGVAVIPSGGSRDEQLEYISEITKNLRGSANDPMEAIRDRIIMIDEQMRVSSQIVHAPGSATINWNNASGRNSAKPAFQLFFWKPISN